MRQRYEKVGQSESESDWSKDEKKGEYSQDEGETDVESEVGAYNDYCSGNSMLYLFLGWPLHVAVLIFFLAGPYMSRNTAQTADQNANEKRRREEYVRAVEFMRKIMQIS